MIKIELSTMRKAIDGDKEIHDMYYTDYSFRLVMTKLMSGVTDEDLIITVKDVIKESKAS